MIEIIALGQVWLIMSEYTYYLIKLSKQALVSGGRCVDDVVLLLVDKQALKPKFAIPWKIYWGKHDLIPFTGKNKLWVSEKWKEKDTHFKWLWSLVGFWRFWNDFKLRNCSISITYTDLHIRGVLLTIVKTYSEMPEISWINLQFKALFLQWRHTVAQHGFFVSNHRLATELNWHSKLRPVIDRARGRRGRTDRRMGAWRAQRLLKSK